MLALPTMFSMVGGRRRWSTDDTLPAPEGTRMHSQDAHRAHRQPPHKDVWFVYQIQQLAIKGATL
jgi:hypothetical protein